MGKQDGEGCLPGGRAQVKLAPRKHMSQTTATEFLCLPTFFLFSFLFLLFCFFLPLMAKFDAEVCCVVLR